MLRIPGDGTDSFIDREREHRNHVAAAAAGVTPPVLHLIQPGYCTIVPFITGETMHPETIAGHPERLRLIVEAVRTYHDRALFDNEIRVFDMIRDYTRMAAEVDAPRPEQTEWMLWVGQRIEQAMQRDEPAPVACHNNLLSENFILTPEGRMWVIDWEYGGMNDPYFDLGDFCVEHPLTADEEKFVLTAYCGGMDEHRFARMMLHKLVVDLWWSIWAMIQCQRLHARVRLLPSTARTASRASARTPLTPTSRAGSTRSEGTPGRSPTTTTTGPAAPSPPRRPARRQYPRT